MVGSNLNSLATAHLYCLATTQGGSDLDGSLLVAESCKIFDGTFNYINQTGSITLESVISVAGVGVTFKNTLIDYLRQHLITI